MDTTSASVIQNNTPLKNLKRWENLNPLPIANGVGFTFIPGNTGVANDGMYITSTTAQYLYEHDTDGFILLPSGAFAGTFSVGTCGVRHPWSITYTCNGGSTTTIQVAAGTHNLTDVVVGQTVEFLSGTAANIGLRVVITKIYSSGQGTGNITLTLDTTVASVTNGDTFRISSGKYYVLSVYTALAAGVFKCFDVGTQAWQASLATTNLPATWAVAGQMVLPYTRYDIFATGTATSGSATTLVNGAKAWTVNQWVGYQVRITAGTGCGQIRVITSNDGTTLNFAAGATIDITSHYSIEGNEDVIYLLGNGVITMYTYTISTNTWATVSPVAARVGTTTSCMLADWIGVSGDADWGTENTIQDGKYIYSPRGTATATIVRYNIPGNTWETLTNANSTTFTTGAESCSLGKYIYYAVNTTSSNIIYRFDVTRNFLEPFTSNYYTQSTLGNRNLMWIKKYDSAGHVFWIYRILHTSSVMQRIMVY